MGDYGLISREKKSYTEIFHEVCPFYLSIGMSYQEFWQGDPCLTHYYGEAFKAKQKRENQMLWLQGFYVYNAIGSFVEILPAFPKKGAKIHPYLEEPVPLTELEREEQIAEKQRRKMEEIKSRMISRALSINARRGGL